MYCSLNLLFNVEQCNISNFLSILTTYFTVHVYKDIIVHLFLCHENNLFCSFICKKKHVSIAYTQLLHICIQFIPAVLSIGEHCGIVVEHRTPKRGVLGLISTGSTVLRP